MIDIGKLSVQLSYHLKWDREQPKPVVDENGETHEQQRYEKFSISNSIDDFVFMCFLVGIWLIICGLDYFAETLKDCLRGVGTVGWRYSSRHR